MKILMSAYSCEPGRGSEPGIGWNTAYEVAKHHQVWVLTRPDESKTEIEAELDRNPVPNLHFIYFTLPIWGGGWRWGQSGAMQIHHYLWQIQAYFVARKLHRQIDFDVIHHVTFAKYSNPSFLSFLPVPFVWGPVAGGESAPFEFWQDFSWSSYAYEIARNLARVLGELDPFVRLTAKKSTVIQATTEETAQQLYKMGVNNVEVVPAIGLPQEDIDFLSNYAIPDGNQIRFISIGRLLHWKGFHLGLRAFACANLPNAEYWILGDGAEFHRLQTLAENLGIAQRVKFWGKLSREETLTKLRDCHVLVHPSLHDSGGWVCLEAMAAGRPVICFNLGGPAVQVTPETGFKVLASNPNEALKDIASAMTQLVKNPQMLINMGEAGRKLVRETYSWQFRGERLSQLYKQMIDY
ncbi:glycosyltransferase family 4 protein [Rivularia sp. UHCC 0363]|uniref:glycosyltransferase family 4 protein n=1 Tax=Rivularia sp. UHCC 0363 TaxID=3110244 RepID=UPI002B1F77EA|nr:glycosyltransferase family 4 protein [Rivularia sp. UHCC 0363]MEA5598353.1 glycosyltransferase family 4 protein [Rivularia sp. UHCC 0363]